MDWLEKLAEDLQVEELSSEESARILSIARQVAHRVERRITPLAAFLIGTAVGAGDADGLTRSQTLDNAIRTVEASLPPEEGEGEEDLPSDPS
jgi:hypothetical protein